MTTTWISDRLLPSNNALLSGRRWMALLVLMSALGAACQMSAGPEPTPGSDLAAWIEPALALAPAASGRPEPAILVIDRTSHDFGQLRVAQSSATTTFTVENTGPKPISGLALHLEQGTGFTVTATTCAGSLDRHAPCTIAVAFAPVHAGPAQAELLVQAGDLAVRATLTGTGAARVRVVNHVAGYGVEVRSEPAGIACGAVCELTVTTHEILLDKGAFDLAAWSGPCEPISESTCLVRLEADTTVELRFFEPGLLWSRTGKFVSALATDAQNHILLSDYRDDSLAKYSPSGATLWQTSAFGTVDKISVDPLGNLGILNWVDGTVQKLDGAGNLQWTIEPSFDEFIYPEIAFDLSGNLYVAGALYSPEEGVSVSRIEKYDPSGALVWTRNSASGPWGGGGTDMAVDQDGNVLILVTEIWYNDVIGTYAVMSLHKYDGDGNLLWTHQELEDTGSLVVDAAGNIFLFRYLGGNLIEKRSPDGTLLWSVPVTSFDYVERLAVTPAGDVIAAGSHLFGDEIRAAKIDGATGEQRRSILIRSDVANAWLMDLAVDGQGDVIIGGLFSGYPRDEYWLRKYDAAIFDRVLE
jgi:outer membrane protein assembly factor BamB